MHVGQSRSRHVLFTWLYVRGLFKKKQDEIFRRKRLSTSANFVHVYFEIWDKGILKLNKFSIKQVKKEQQCDSLMFAFITVY